MLINPITAHKTAVNTLQEYTVLLVAAAVRSDSLSVVVVVVEARMVDQAS
jgi:hypothetical protein